MLRNLARNALLLALPWACAGPAGAQDPPPTPPAVAEHSPGVWKEFSSPEGRFSVLFPGTPQKQSQRVPTPDGKAIVMFIHTLRTSAEYGVIFADYPFDVTGPDMAKRLLDAVARGAVAQVQAELLSIEEISLGGHPGRALKERLPGGEIMHVRVYLVGPRLYQIAITLPKGAGAAGPALGPWEETASRFLDSFKLTPARTAAQDAAEARPLLGDPVGVPAQDHTEGEVDRLLKSLREKGEAVYGTRDDARQGGPSSDDKASGGILSDKAIVKPQPDYPPIAKAARVQGPVEVLVIIDEEGSVVAAQAHSGHPLLRAAAVKAARGARFSPVLLEGRPVRVSGVITYNFVLR